jgi:hypothetical protein
MPELTEQLLTDIARLPKQDRTQVMAHVWKAEWEKCADDVLYWLDASRHELLGPYVYTKDPKALLKCSLCEGTDREILHQFQKRDTHLKTYHDITPTNEKERKGFFTENSTIRQFPMMPYMVPIIETWMREQIVFMEKSRDMMATWIAVALFTWDTLFHKGRENIFQSEDAEKTKDLIERAFFIWEHQPPGLRNQHKAVIASTTSKSGRLTVKSLDSVLLGFPQGANQIRQYHPTGVFQDEAAFQVDAGEAFAAIKPAIQAGGKFTAVSTANVSWFMLVCQDKDDELLGMG